MDEAMIQNWNRVVAPNDTVHHLGDFAFAKIDRVKSILKRLNGRKCFVNGNHDKVIKENKHELLDGGFIDSLHDYREIYVDNQFIVLFHYPMLQYNKGHHGAFALHGHCHGSVVAPGKQVDVGVDSTFITGKAEYRPFSFYEIKDFMSTKENIMHHGD
jgi:calcineurin-like phosphoesterase family protein